MKDKANDILAVADTMPSDFSTRARLHYATALRKHPRFADRLFCRGEVMKSKHGEILPDLERSLAIERCEIARDDAKEQLDALSLLACEFREAYAECLRGDKAACVDELYDAVAVLMRMIAVVEGRQKLGGEK